MQAPQHFKPGTVTTADGVTIETNVRAVGDMPLPHEMACAIKMQMFGCFVTMRQMLTEAMPNLSHGERAAMLGTIDDSETLAITTATRIERYFNTRAHKGALPHDRPQSCADG